MLYHRIAELDYYVSSMHASFIYMFYTFSQVRKLKYQLIVILSISVSQIFVINEIILQQRWKQKSHLSGLTTNQKSDNCLTPAICVFPFSAKDQGSFTCPFSDHSSLFILPCPSDLSYVDCQFWRVHNVFNQRLFHWLGFDTPAFELHPTTVTRRGLTIFSITSSPVN